MKNQDNIFVFPTRHDPGGKVRIAIPKHITSTAKFSSCDRYRYSLMRMWNENLPGVMFLMMNPSTADLQKNDPTVAKCMRLAVRWGYGRLYVGNVCAYRATDKRNLLFVDDPVGAENHASLLAMAGHVGRIVVAHGKLPTGLQQHAVRACVALQEAGHSLHVLKLSETDGTPWHPLYIKEDQVPFPWGGPS